MFVSRCNRVRVVCNRLQLLVTNDSDQADSLPCRCRQEQNYFLNGVQETFTSVDTTDWKGALAGCGGVQCSLAQCTLNWKVRFRYTDNKCLVNPVEVIEEPISDDVFVKGQDRCVSSSSLSLADICICRDYTACLVLTITNHARLGNHKGAIACIVHVI